MASKSISSYSDRTSDEALLERLGYKQELKREFSGFELFGLSFSIIGLIPSIASTIIFALPNGGPIAMVWGWTICSFFLMSIALSIAELASSAPTSGGLYFWTYQYCSPRWRNIMSWIVGYSNTLSNFAAVASIDWGCAVQIMAAVTIGTDGNFVPTTGHIFGVLCAVVISHALLCSLGANVIARLQTPYIILNVLLCLAIIIGVPAATPPEFRNTAKFAFSGFDNMMGWSDSFAVVLSFLYPLWSIGGFDAGVHISEEATNASVAVPWAVTISTALGCGLGWIANVALVFCMGTDIDSIVNSPIQQPMAAILLQCFGKKGTLCVWAFIVIVQYMIGTNMLTAASRQTFAFARDGALPFSRWLYYVHPTLRTPQHCVWFTAGFGILLCLLAFAGQSAIGAVFALAVACQYVVYSIPIAARFLGGNKFQKGPFSLGFFSLPIAVISVLWMVFNVVLFMFPASPNPTAAQMNYSVVVLGGTIFLAVCYYFFPKVGGKYWFNGPVSNLSPSMASDSGQNVVSQGTEKEDDIPEEHEKKI